MFSSTWNVNEENGISLKNIMLPSSCLIRKFYMRFMSQVDGFPLFFPGYYQRSDPNLK